MTNAGSQVRDDSPAIPEAGTGRIQALIDQRRAAEREAQQAHQRLVNLPPPRPAGDESQYRNDAEWRNAVVQEAVIEAHRSAARVTAEEAAQRAFHARGQTFQARVDGFKERAPDWDQVARNPNLPVTQVMADAITDSNLGPQVSYWLGQNPHEAARIASLPPIRQVAEIGQLEARLGSGQVAPTTTSAPTPSRSVSSSTSAPSEPDLGDPGMSNEEYRRRRMSQRSSR
jgi:hypothetical protein